MKSFRTELYLQAFPEKIQLKDTLVTMGSCFAEVIGRYLLDYKFTVLNNPYGTTYNPHSIHIQLLHSLYNEPVPEHTYLENNNLYFNYTFHSSISSDSSASLDNQLTELTGTVHHRLAGAHWLILTYGTAWVYRRKDTSDIVANCHKMPGNLFEKELLTQKKIIESFDTVYKAIKSFNPNLRLILTVSPVRHIKDTLPLNNVSKSVLRLVCHTLTQQYRDVYYFPAYEIMMDDLRDYRFYKSDMIHPSEEAEQYIWQKFSSSFFEDDTHRFIDVWKGIQSDLKHRPFHPNSPGHQQFLHNLLRQLNEVSKQVNVDSEINLVRSQIN
jgi:hypothetical protein